MQQGGNNNLYNKLRLVGTSPGGWGCYCCGPAPANRKRWMRRVRRRFKQETHNEIKKEIR